MHLENKSQTLTARHACVCLAEGHGGKFAATDRHKHWQLWRTAASALTFFFFFKKSIKIMKLKSLKDDNKHRFN